MAKTKYLSNVEKYAVQAMMELGKTSEEIAAELDRPTLLVSNYIDEVAFAKAKIKKNLAKSKEAPKRPKAGDFFVNKTGSGKKGIATMTQTSAEMSDGAAKSDPSSNPRYDSIVFRRPEVK